MTPRSKYPGRESRATMTKTVVELPDAECDLGFGSEIFWVEYVVNGIRDTTSLCPNAAHLFWEWLKRKHSIKTIKTFEYKIIKQIGESIAY